MHHYKRLAKLIPILLVSILLLASISILTLPVSANGGWYHEDWDTRRELTITGSTAGAVTDYQLKVIVSSLNDSEDIYLDSTHQADYDDVRFTESDGVTLIDYWIESYNAGVNATIWVEFPSIPESPSTATYYIYYDNAEATAVSSGVDTFLFFDDFSSDLSKWDVERGSWSIVSEQLKKTGGTGSACIYSDATIALPALGYRLQGYFVARDGTYDTALGMNDQKALINPTTGAYCWYALSDDWRISEWTGSEWYDGECNNGLVCDDPYPADNYIMTFTKTDDGELTEYIDHTFAQTTTDTTVTDVGVNWYLRYYTYDNNVLWDDIWVGNFCEPEPTLAEGAEEEQAGSPVLTTNAATDILTYSAILPGNITTVGATNITERGFEWDTDSGAPYANNWTEEGTWGTGTYSYNATLVHYDTQYYFRAMAKNDADLWGYGGELDFTTLEPLPSAPTDFTITQTGSGSISITWVNGTYADTTIVRYDVDRYPTDITDGWEVYNGSSNNTTAVGLSLSSHEYCYRAWSENEIGYSVEYAEGIIGEVNFMMSLIFIALAMGFMGFGLLAHKTYLLPMAGASWFGLGAYGLWIQDTSTGDVLWILGWIGMMMTVIMFLALIGVGMAGSRTTQKWARLETIMRKSPSEAYDEELRTIRQGVRDRKVARRAGRY